MGQSKSRPVEKTTSSCDFTDEEVNQFVRELMKKCHTFPDTCPFLSTESKLNEYKLAHILARGCQTKRTRFEKGRQQPPVWRIHTPHVRGSLSREEQERAHDLIGQFRDNSKKYVRAINKECPPNLSLQQQTDYCKNVLLRYKKFLEDIQYNNTLPSSMTVEWFQRPSTRFPGIEYPYMLQKPEELDEFMQKWQTEGEHALHILGNR
jgi:hypothetical protein